ncbi:Multidrug export protein MepA [Pseudovibrio axinellae]|uniref:Multidrug export protein MepA n=1 Tax=Pseudovibrio axinellae TaxID=989403 RepID=A0A165UPB2_9HYPH|nr:MATE family efflux transporter [Pseudovibrio axinellae]KZL12647.1 Multidrug export protein MepA [Pseudovibrio axinellae]SEP63084.1 putative efflux protein, MATE family [Pseudovibrio axinellae]
MSVVSAEEQMITGRPAKEFTRFAVPAVLGLISIASASIVDGIFVGNYVGSTALAAISLITPMFSLFFGVVVMLTVGAAVIAGKFIGERRYADASNIFTKALISVVGVSTLFALLLIVFTPTVAKALGANAETAELVEVYIRTVAWFFPGLSLAVSMSHFLRVDGRPNFSLASLVLITLVNIILDALMIGYWGWGVWGAALATGIASQVGMVFMLFHFFKKDAKLKPIRPFGSWKVMQTAAYNGFSEFINDSSAGLVAFLCNWILITEIGAQGVAAFTIVSYLFFTGIMIFYGVGEGLGPLVSVNYGARKPRRIFQFLKIGVGTNVAIGLCLAALLILEPVMLASAFLESGEQATIDMTVQIIAVIWPVFLFSGANIAFSGYFTGMHCATQSALIAVSRSLALPLLLIVGLWQVTGPMSVFYALPIAEALTMVLTIALFLKKKPHSIVWKTRRFAIEAQ